MKKVFEKSIVAKNNLKVEQTIKFKDLAFKKPGIGIKTKYYKKLLNKKINKNIKKDQRIKWEDIKKK